MILKTLVAGIIAAVLAAGVIYYGTPGQSAAGGVSIHNENSPIQPYRQNKNLIDKMIEPLNNFKNARARSAQQQRQTTPVTKPEPQNTRPQSSANNTHQPQSIKAAPPRSAVAHAIQTIEAVMTQAKEIKQSDLRDRAYLDVVDYSLTYGLYVDANAAMELIAQVELRDTARSRMAIAIAKSGDAERAFALIDDVEVNELRDVMRLQVIEALIVPQQPPNSFQ